MADIAITATAVLKGTGSQTQSGIAGAAITAGQALYLDTSATPNVLKLADANGSATTAAIVGIALNGGAIGQTITYLTGGLLTCGGTVVVGDIIILSATAGAIAPAADLATTMYPVIIGTTTTAAIISVSFQIGTVAHA